MTDFNEKYKGKGPFWGCPKRAILDPFLSGPGPKVPRICWGPGRLWAGFGAYGQKGHFGPFWAQIRLYGPKYRVLGHIGPIWAILALYGPYGPIWPKTRYLGHIGQKGHFGPIQPNRAIWAYGPNTGFWAQMAQVSSKWGFGPYLGHFGHIGQKGHFDQNSGFWSFWGVHPDSAQITGFHCIWALPAALGVLLGFWAYFGPYLTYLGHI